MALSSLADLYEYFHDDEQALRYYKEAIQKRRETENDFAADSALYHLGMLSLRQGKYEQTLACFLQAAIKGHFPAQDMIQQGMKGLWERLGEEQFAHLLKQVEPHASEIVTLLLERE